VSALRSFIDKQNLFRQVTKERPLDIDHLENDDICFLKEIFDFCLSSENLLLSAGPEPHLNAEYLNEIAFFGEASQELAVLVAKKAILNKKIKNRGVANFA